MASLMLLFINLKATAAGKIFRQLFINFARLLIQLVLVVSSYAQETDFMLQIVTAKDQTVTDIVQNDEYSYTLLGFYTDSAHRSSPFTESIVYKISSEGFIIDSLIIAADNRDLMLSFILQENQDSLLLAGFSLDTGNQATNTSLELIRINPLLNIIDRQSYFLSYDREPGWIYADKNQSGQIILCGRTERFPNQPILRAFYFKTSNSLDSLLYWEYEELNLNNSPSNIRQVNDTTIWSCEMNLYFFQFVIRDSSFNLINQKKIPDRVSDNFGIKWDSDSSFYVLGEWDGGPDDDVGIIRMFDPIDTTGHLFASWGTLDTLDFPARNNGLDFKNKDSIFAGGTANFLGSNSYFFLTQFDSILNLRWERFYGGDGYYQMDKIVATNDGGCIMAGTKIDESYPYEKHDAIIIKVNHEGYIVAIPESNFPQARDVILYPNPGSEWLNVRLGRQHAEGWLVLYSITGQPVLSMHLTDTITKINTQFLPSGSYIYKIINLEGLNESGIWIKK